MLFDFEVLSKEAAGGSRELAKRSGAYYLHRYQCRRGSRPVSEMRYPWSWFIYPVAEVRADELIKGQTGTSTGPCSTVDVVVDYPSRIRVSGVNTCLKWRAVCGRDVQRRIMMIFTQRQVSYS